MDNKALAGQISENLWVLRDTGNLPLTYAEIAEKVPTDYKVTPAIVKAVFAMRSRGAGVNELFVAAILKHGLELEGETVEALAAALDRKAEPYKAEYQRQQAYAKQFKELCATNVASLEAPDQMVSVEVYIRQAMRFLKGKEPRKYFVKPYTDKTKLSNLNMRHVLEGEPAGDGVFAQILQYWDETHPQIALQKLQAAVTEAQKPPAPVPEEDVETRGLRASIGQSLAILSFCDEYKALSKRPFFPTSREEYKELTKCSGPEVAAILAGKDRTKHNDEKISDAALLAFVKALGVNGETLQAAADDLATLAEPHRELWQQHEAFAEYVRNWYDEGTNVQKLSAGLKAAYPKPDSFCDVVSQSKDVSHATARNVWDGVRMGTDAAVKVLWNIRQGTAEALIAHLMSKLPKQPLQPPKAAHVIEDRDENKIVMWTPSRVREALHITTKTPALEELKVPAPACDEVLDRAVWLEARRLYVKDQKCREYIQFGEGNSVKVASFLVDTHVDPNAYIRVMPSEEKEAHQGKRIQAGIARGIKRAAVLKQIPQAWEQLSEADGKADDVPATELADKRRSVRNDKDAAAKDAAVLVPEG